MKLIFAHIVEHNILQDISITFCSQFKGSFDGKSLNIDKNYDYLADYYDGVDISAIIGKNGSGKTSVLDFIETSTSYSESIGFIVWFREKDSCYTIQSVNHKFDFKININIPGSLTCITSTGIGDLASSFKDCIKESRLSYLKVNNVNEFQFYPELKRNNNFVVDYSMSNINRSSAKKTEFMQRLFYFLNSDAWTESRDTRIAYKFTLKSISKSVYLQIERDFKDDRLTKYISTRFRKWNDYDDSIVTKDFDVDLFYSKNMDDSFTKLKQRLQSITSCGFHLSPLFENINQAITFSNIFTLINSTYRELEISELLKKFINIEFCFFLLYSENIITNDIGSIIETAYSESKLYIDNKRSDDDFSDYSETSHEDFTSLLSKIKLGLDSYSDLSGFLYESLGNIKGISSNSFSVNDASYLSEIHHKIEHMKNWLNGNIVYGWEGFSSGELARIGLFSLIYDYLIHCEDRYTLIVIDEVDLYLHPEWQRTFVSELIKMIKRIQMEERVQIIITSHSPLIIGDFLPEDIISLKVINGRTIIDKSLGFGTKLSDTYLDGMHLESTYGEHSRYKLQTLIDKKVNNEKMTKKDLKLAMKISNASLRGSLLND